MLFPVYLFLLFTQYLPMTPNVSGKIGNTGVILFIRLRPFGRKHIKFLSAQVSSSEATSVTADKLSVKPSARPTTDIIITALERECTACTV